MSPMRSGRSPRLQRGQALVLTIAFSAVCAVMVFFIFSTSQLANQKTKLQNTADAAAYSAGVLQARDYNFSAYTNRAMVANHVAVAQMVGLDSWTDEITTEFKTDPYVPFASKSFWASMAVTGPLLWTAPEKATYAAAKVARGLFDKEKVATPSIELIIEALRVAQVAFHDATMLQFGVGAVEGVVKANDPLASISTSTFNVPNTTAEIVRWKNFTRTMSTDAQIKRFADVTVDSAAQDGFTHSRNAAIRLPTPDIFLSPFNPLVCAELGVPTVMTMDMTHGGGTQLSSDMKRWFAIDAAGVYGAAECQELLVAPVVIPVLSLWMEAEAHAGSMAGSKSGYGGLTGYSTPRTSSYAFGQVGGALANPVTEIPGGIQLAEGPGNNVASNYKGMRSYEEVASYSTKPTSQVDATSMAPTLTLEIEKKGSDIHTAAQVLPGSDMLKLDDQLKGNVMRVLATSQTYFMRPQTAAHRKLLDASWKRDDDKTEYANLFNPYWQTRLVATPALLIDASAAAQ